MLEKKFFHNVKDTANEIYTVYGTGGTTITTIRNCFKRFRAGNFNSKGGDCNGRTVTMGTDLIAAMLVKNPRYIVCQRVDAISIPRKTVHNRLITNYTPIDRDQPYEPCLHVEFIFPKTRKRSFLKEDLDFLPKCVSKTYLVQKQ